MKLQEIKDAVLAGKTVYWKNSNYKIVYGEDWLIVYNHGQNNENCIGLTWRDGETLNGEEKEFYLSDANDWSKDPEYCPFCKGGVIFMTHAEILEEGELKSVEEWQCATSGRSFYV